MTYSNPLYAENAEMHLHMIKQYAVLAMVAAFVSGCGRSLESDTVRKASGTSSLEERMNAFSPDGVKRVDDEQAQTIRELFAAEVPEIASGIVEIKHVACRAGTRAKVVVSSADSQVDCVGACVGAGGSRVQKIVDACGGIRIDIIRYSDDRPTYVANSLQPLQVEEFIWCPIPNRVIALVADDQIPLVLQDTGLNVRLAAEVTGSPIAVFTERELHQLIDLAIKDFCTLDGVNASTAETLVEQGILTIEELAACTEDDLTGMGGVRQREATMIISSAQRRNATNKQ